MVLRIGTKIPASALLGIFSFHIIPHWLPINNVNYKINYMSTPSLYNWASFYFIDARFIPRSKAWMPTWCLQTRMESSRHWRGQTVTGNMSRQQTTSLSKSVFYCLIWQEWHGDRERLLHPSGQSDWQLSESSNITILTWKKPAAGVWRWILSVLLFCSMTTNVLSSWETFRLVSVSASFCFHGRFTLTLGSPSWISVCV